MWDLWLRWNPDFQQEYTLIVEKTITSCKKFYRVFSELSFILNTIYCSIRHLRPQVLPIEKSLETIRGHLVVHGKARYSTINFIQISRFPVYQYLVGSIF